MNWRLHIGQAAQAGLFLLSFLFYTAFVTDALFLIGVQVNCLIVPAALILATLTVTFLSDNRKRALVTSLLCVVFVAMGAAAMSMIYDPTADSMGYHYDMVVMMADGWNPFTANPPNGSLWAKHYAKLLETAGAAVLAFTGNLQSVKCINLVFAGAALAVMWHALTIALPRVSKKWRIMLVIMAACNPVLIAQSFSAYNDYCIWIETVLLVSTFMLLWHDESDTFAYIVLFMTVAIGANTKFTHFFYLGLECLFFAGWCLYFKRYRLFKSGFLAVISGVIIGVFVMGYNPYVLNTVNHANPVYPLGSDAVDIMTGNTPAIFHEGNRLTNFAKSLMSAERCPWGVVNADMRLSSAVRSYSNDARVNGFGIFMLPMLIIGLVLMIINRPPVRWWVLYLSIFAMCLCFEQSWWARYIPFLWLALLLPVVISLTGRRCRSAANRVLRVCVFVLCCINGTFSLGATAASRLGYTRYIDYVFTTQKSLGKPIHVVNIRHAMRQQFRERGVEIIEHKNLSEISDRDELFRIFSFTFFDSYMLLPEKDYPLLYRTPRTLLDRWARYDQRRYTTESQDIKL